MISHMFTMRMTQDPDVLDLLFCIPVDDSFDGTERMEFAETQALCIYYRGPYEETATAIRALAEYVKENNIETTGTAGGLSLSPNSFSRLSKFPTSENSLFPFVY